MESHASTWTPALGCGPSHASIGALGATTVAEGVQGEPGRRLLRRRR